MEPNAKILEWMKRIAEPGETCELKETAWSYRVKCGEKSFGQISRFLADENFEVSASDIRQHWQHWNQYERMDFASNWLCKPTWNHEDTEILEMMMSDGDDLVLSCCALAFLKHPDRDRAITFLIDRTLQGGYEDEPLNYIQALGMFKDVRAMPAIRPYYEKYRNALETESELGVPEDVFFDAFPSRSIDSKKSTQQRCVSG
jgi:hypothetical protein